MAGEPLIEARGLSVAFGPPDRPVRAVADLDLAIRPGEILGIAGESGSGKSTLSAALMGVLPPAARVAGEVRFRGRSLYDLPRAELRRLWGREIGMILQNPMTSLDPLYTIGSQLGEVLAVHGQAADRRARSLDVLRSVHLTAPELRLRQYPHELSGGMRQRTLIGMASAAAPKLLLADEPTTALDATIQEEILLLFAEIRERHGTAIAIVTHDLGVIRRICDRVVVMYAGHIVEDGPVEALFTRPRHPYTRALLASIPRVRDGEVTLQPIPGQVPDLAALGDFCAFAERCPMADERCRRDQPREQVLDGRRVFCWHADRAA